MNKKAIIYFLTLFLGYPLFAQEDSSNVKKTTFKLSLYADSYYAWFSDTLSNPNLQPYTTVGARNNSFGINTAQLGLNYQSEKFRGQITLHYGDIA